MPRARRLLLTALAAGAGLAAGALLAGRDVPERGPRTALRDRGAPPAPRIAGVPDAAARRDRAPRAAPPAVTVPVAAAPVPAAAAGPAEPRPGRRILFGVDARPQEGDLGALARALLERHRDALGVSRMPGELRLVSEETTLSGHHVHFGQFVDGVEVEGAEVSAHVARDGRPLLLLADLFEAGGVATEPSLGADEALEVARDALAGDEDDAPAAFESKPAVLVLLPEGRSAVLAWRIDARTDDESVRLWIAARDAIDAGAADAGDVLASRDLRAGAEGEARVFQPNPVFTARNGGLRDKKDGYSPQLEAELVRVTLLRLDGTGRVRGQWCDTARGKGDVYTPTHDWTSLTRSDDEFEHVNAYWHVDRVQQRLQDLGITGVNDEPQKVDVHALSDDQSYYDLYGDVIRYGDGGVDDAEDGDIVVHEYGHAIQDDQVRGYGSSREGGAMGEGFADFLACTFHATGNPVWDPLVASWDATSYSGAHPPFLRRVDKAKVYPRDVVNEVHADGEIWSRFLWDLRAAIGADDALRVAIESHEYVAASSGFKDGANGVLVANIALRGGADDGIIRSTLRARGLPFSAEPAGPPPEDAFEPNDDQIDAAPLAPDVYANLLLADDDWFRVDVPEYRRLSARADFDAGDLDLDLELRAASGALIASSRAPGGVAVTEAAVGRGGAPLFVRARPAPGFTGSGGYRLTISDLDLERVRAGRTSVRRASASISDTVAVTVGVNKVDAGRRLIVVSRSARRGAVNDVRLVSPSGAVAADLGTGRTRRGARVSADLSEPGDWRVETEARDGTSGRYTLRVKFR